MGELYAHYNEADSPQPGSDQARVLTWGLPSLLETRWPADVAWFKSVGRRPRFVYAGPFGMRRTDAGHFIDIDGYAAATKDSRLKWLTDTWIDRLAEFKAQTDAEIVIRAGRFHPDLVAPLDRARIDLFMHRMWLALRPYIVTGCEIAVDSLAAINVESVMFKLVDMLAGRRGMERRVWGEPAPKNEAQRQAWPRLNICCRTDWWTRQVANGNHADIEFTLTNGHRYMLLAGEDVAADAPDTRSAWVLRRLAEGYDVACNPAWFTDTDASLWEQTIVTPFGGSPVAP